MERNMDMVGLFLMGSLFMKANGKMVYTITSIGIFQINKSFMKATMYTKEPSKTADNCIMKET